ncbi:MAG: site-specific integrase [Bacteroidota bacterium]
MASIKLYFDTRRSKSNETYSLKLKLFHQDKARYIPLGYFFKKNQWIEKDHKVRSNYPNSAKVNTRISYLVSQANQLLLNYQAELDYLSVDQLKSKLSAQLFNQKDKPQKIIPNLFEYIDTLVVRLKKSKRLGSAQTYQTCSNVIRRFNENQDLRLVEIDHRFLLDFEADCLNKGIRVNSIGVYLRTLRAIINKAIAEGLLKSENYPFKKFRIKQEKTAKRAISKEEIQRIVEVKIDPNLRMWHSRNYFVFMFNMRGMNFIDMAYLKMENIQNGRILYKRKKTGKLYNIKLTAKAAEIIQFYAKSKHSHSSKRVFPILLQDRFTDAERERKHFIDRRKKFTQDLKKIAQLCEINTNLTSYVSRHSWASIAKFSGVAPAVIGESLGHSDLKTTETYLANFDHDVLDDANELITS